jgi:hypothetical protein
MFIKLVVRLRARDSITRPTRAKEAEEARGFPAGASRGASDSPAIEIESRLIKG